MLQAYNELVVYCLSIVSFARLQLWLPRTHLQSTAVPRRQDPVRASRRLQQQTKQLTSPVSCRNAAACRQERASASLHDSSSSSSTAPNSATTAESQSAPPRRQSERIQRFPVLACHNRWQTAREDSVRPREGRPTSVESQRRQPSRRPASKECFFQNHSIATATKRT